MPLKLRRWWWARTHNWSALANNISKANGDEVDLTAEQIESAVRTLEANHGPLR